MNLGQIALATGRGMRWALRRGVMMLEPQDGPWANNNNWGDQRFAPLPAAPGQVVQVLPKNSRMYGPPHVHSAALVRSDEVNSGNADVYAQWKVGCGGIENVFQTDWLHGMQLTLVCNSLSVNAVSYAPAADFAYDAADATVSLGVMVAKGSTNPAGLPASFTEPELAIAAAGRHTFDVPDFARSVIVHVFYNGGGTNSNPATQTKTLIGFLAKGGIGLASYDAQVCAGGRAIPIPGGTNQVQVFNDAANQTAQVAVQWQLGL